MVIETLPALLPQCQRQDPAAGRDHARARRRIARAAHADRTGREGLLGGHHLPCWRRLAPAAIVDKLSAGMQKAAAMESVKQAAQKLGADAVARRRPTPAACCSRETARWAEVVRLSAANDGRPDTHDAQAVDTSHHRRRIGRRQPAAPVPAVAARRRQPASACGCTNRRSAPGRAAPGTTCAATCSISRPAICRRWPTSAWTSWAGCAGGIPPGWPATGGRRDRSGRFPAPAAVRRLHGRRLRAGARAGAKPGRDAGTRARASPASRRWQRTRAGVGGIGAALCGAPRGVVQRQPALARLPSAGSRAGYFNSPYPVSELAAGIAADATVCVIGTSLSAVDAVVALQQAGHRGPLICVSRNGRLPSVRSPHNRPPRGLTELSRDGAQVLAHARRRLTLERIAAALGREVRALGGAVDAEDILGVDGDARAALDDEIRRSERRAPMAGGGRGDQRGRGPDLASAAGRRARALPVAMARAVDGAPRQLSDAQRAQAAGVVPRRPARGAKRLRRQPP